MAKETLLNFPNTRDIKVGAAYSETDENTLAGAVYTITYANGDNEYHSTSGFGISSRFVNGKDQALINGPSFITSRGDYQISSNGMVEIRADKDFVVMSGPADIKDLTDEYHTILMSGYGSMLNSLQDDREDLYLKAKGLKKDTDGTIVKDQSITPDISKNSMLRVTDVHPSYRVNIPDVKKKGENKEKKDWGFMEVIEFIISIPSEIVKAFNNIFEKMADILIDLFYGSIKDNACTLSKNMPYLSHYNPYYNNRKEYFKVPIPPSFKDIYGSADFVTDAAKTAGTDYSKEYAKSGDAEKAAKFAYNKFFESIKADLKDKANILGKSYPPAKKSDDKHEQELLDEYWKRTEKGETVDNYTYGYVGPMKAAEKEKEADEHIKEVKESKSVNLESLNKSLGYKK